MITLNLKRENFWLDLIDGVRVGSATVGTPSLDNLPLEAVDRIEIVRGPMSSLYGNGAMGGVVQIFTRRGSASPQFSAQVAAGGLGGALQKTFTPCFECVIDGGVRATAYTGADFLHGRPNALGNQGIGGKVNPLVGCGKDHGGFLCAARGVAILKGKK